ncbi:hypothetical protein [Falsirhodobacter algicola]|uniref:DUF3618 domain-containing protein n=1 Tax=Falsirhodobacter algicola TaxID=2692330 RepID=A0A8J8SKR3_9RHOB|nr:hypothetical protein [Falsirhodobacter algicola]QUS35638.1 hypothetical protein GR316_04750 [Falsirhodobacter algicola]
MTQSPETIEVEVETNRSNVEGTLNALREKASLHGILNDATRYVGLEDPRGSLEAAGRQVRSNPVAFGLIGLGLVALAGGVATRRAAPNYVPTMPSKPSFSKSYGSSASSERLDGYRRQASERLDGARRQASDLSDKALAQAESHPVLFGAVALAAGALLGAALPRTRSEDRVLGPHHDRLYDQAVETAEDLKDRATAAAQAGLDAAKSKAYEEDLIPEEPLVDKVQSVAESAATAAQERFKDPDRI